MASTTSWRLRDLSQLPMKRSVRPCLSADGGTGYLQMVGFMFCKDLASRQASKHAGRASCDNACHGGWVVVGGGGGGSDSHLGRVHEVDAQIEGVAELLVRFLLGVLRAPRHGAQAAFCEQQPPLTDSPNTSNVARHLQQRSYTSDHDLIRDGRTADLQVRVPQLNSVGCLSWWRCHCCLDAACNSPPA